MTEKDDLQQRAAAVAREKAGQFPENRDTLSSEEMRQMVHELRVHQIELEMQNEELRRAQMELDATRARYFDLYDLAPVGYLTVNSQGLILEANLTAAILLGPTRGALVRQPLTRFIMPDDQDIYYHHCKQLFETGKPQTCDMQMIKNDGTEFRGHLATSIEKNIDGEPVWRAMLSDITDRKKLEDALRQSEQKLCNMADNLPNAMVYQLTAEPDGGRRFIYVSGGVERLNEVTAEEVLADATVLYRQVLPEYLTVVREREEEALRTLTTMRVEVRSRLPSGRLRWFEYASTPRHLADGLLVWDGVEVDITDRKQAEDELRESERKLATLIANIQGMVYFCLNDPDWTMKFVSGGALELTGYLPDELVDNRVVSYNDIIHPDDRKYVWDTVQDSFAARSEYTMEYRIVTKKGAVKQVWERGQGIFLPGGELHHLEGFIADITDRKALEDRLRQAQKMESVGRLAGGVAHDFNNMLGVILGFVELALDRIDSAHPVHNDLLEIREAAKRSAGLTRQLLAFASLQPAAPKLLDLNEILEGMLQMLRRLIGEDINLIWMRGVGLGPVKMDPSQIDQILVNLCVNARDAISGPGNVTIETRASAFDKAFCAEHPDFIPGDYVSLSVSDDGCGMDKETLVNIFEPFFTTKGLIDGPGLGLSTIYGIVRQNNGFIDVHSEPGVGTTFNIYLPRHPVPIVPASVPASPEPLKHGRETILLVEDEPAVLKVTEMMLAHIGYTVLAVNTPDKAFRIAEAYAGDIALLITDVVMPEMNGKDLSMKLQSRYPRLKCLFMSGYMADIITPGDVLEEGVHFLQKPFTIKGLAAAVREVLEFEDI